EPAPAAPPPTPTASAPAPASVEVAAGVVPSPRGPVLLYGAAATRRPTAV
ncbi:MAG TPA: type VI secretion protein, partial [Streptomyces sp.]|nr:type VI secretion protein [Streptomyces sp.]